jgi:23S rRNA (uridine2552-2'-O)-methyltransferase
MQEHFDDEFVKKAQAEGYRARSVYKFSEINEKDHLVKSDSVIVDLGAAPGGWTQYAVQKVGAKGQVFALDILPMDSIAGVEIIQGDFTEDAVLQQLLDCIARKKGVNPETHAVVDLVISDMAPNISGMKVIDQPRAMLLVELALDFAYRTLKKDGAFVAKVFQGEGFEAYIANLRKHFKRVVSRKPKASRDRSQEIFLVATGYKGGGEIS